jgi:ribonuclease T2
MRCLLLLCFVVWLFSFPAFLIASHKHHKSSAAGSFDYYLLSLSWAPNYCAEHPSDHSQECSGHMTFVLHGLWPQSETAAPPMDCGGNGSVPSATVDHVLQFMPSRGLIQHEWSKHGTCSGLSPGDYFKTVEQAFTTVQVPEPYRHLSRETRAKVSDLEQSFAAANHAPEQAFRVSCHSGELVGVEVCFDKNLQYRACTSSARECSSSSVTVQEPKQ